MAIVTAAASSPSTTRAPTVGRIALSTASTSPWVSVGMRKYCGGSPGTWPRSRMSSSSSFICALTRTNSSRAGFTPAAPSASDSEK